jgi:hypothetical protein
MPGMREEMPLMDAFDRFWHWANKPLDSGETITAELHHAVTSLPMEDWHDRDKVNEAARANGWRE